MSIIYRPYGVGNSEGFPPEYPRESRQRTIGEPVPVGWLEVSEVEFRQLLQTHYAAVETVTAGNEEAERTRITERVQRARQRFSDCAAVDSDWANATNAQKFGMMRDLYKIINSVQGEIIDLIKDKGNDS